MHVSVETLKGLERKITVSVPTDIIEEEVKIRLKKLARDVKMDGFRPGNVPMDIVTKRYGDGVRHEVARDLIQSSLSEAIEKHELSPADYPNVQPFEIKKGEDFKFTAELEVLPEFDIFELNKTPVELIKSSVTDKDVNNMLEKLREQNTEWIEVSHPAEKGNKVIIDFEGFLNGEAFKGGTAKGHELILGSGQMIPGFEDGIIGKEIAKSFDIQVKFPKDYGHEELADKKVSFTITVHKVLESRLPALDDDFVSKFNLKTGGIEALSKDIKHNMELELEKRVDLLNREKIFDKLLEFNKFELPASLIEKEIEHLKHEAYHRIFGHEHKENEKIPDFPRALFEEQAKRRVHLGLLFTKYVKKHQIVADSERVDSIIDRFALAFEHPEEMRKYYKHDKERRGEIEALVLEEMVAERIANDATVKYANKDYDSVMNQQDGTKDKGE